MTDRHATVGKIGAEEKCMGDLLGDINAAIVRRIPEGLTHEDVFSAALNLLAHHAHRIGMPRAEVQGHVDNAFDCHAPKVVQ